VHARMLGEMNIRDRSVKDDLEKRRRWQTKGITWEKNCRHDFFYVMKVKSVAKEKDRVCVPHWPPKKRRGNYYNNKDELKKGDEKESLETKQEGV